MHVPQSLLGSANHVKRASTNNPPRARLLPKLSPTDLESSRKRWVLTGTGGVSLEERGGDRASLLGRDCADALSDSRGAGRTGCPAGECPGSASYAVHDGVESEESEKLGVRLGEKRAARLARKKTAAPGGRASSRPIPGRSAKQAEASSAAIAAISLPQAIALALTAEVGTAHETNISLRSICIAIATCNTCSSDSALRKLGRALTRRLRRSSRRKWGHPMSMHTRGGDHRRSIRKINRER